MVVNYARFDAIETDSEDELGGAEAGQTIGVSDHRCTRGHWMNRQPYSLGYYSAQLRSLLTVRRLCVTDIVAGI